MLALLRPLLPLFEDLLTAGTYVDLHIHVHYTRAGFAPAVLTTAPLTALPAGLTLAAGRPKLPVVLADVLERATTLNFHGKGAAGWKKSQGVVVGVCGPLALGEQVRDVVRGVDRKSVKAAGGIEIHEEYVSCSFVGCGSRKYLTGWFVFFLQSVWVVTICVSSPHTLPLSTRDSSRIHSFSRTTHTYTDIPHPQQQAYPTYYSYSPIYIVILFSTSPTRLAPVSTDSSLTSRPVVDPPVTSLHVDHDARAGCAVLLRSIHPSQSLSCLGSWLSLR